MWNRRHFLAAGAALVGGGPLLAADRPLDIALVGGRVWTGTGGAPQRMAIGLAGDRIAVLGDSAVKARSTSATQVIDLDGAFVTPAFIDNHTHFLLGSTTLQQVSLREAASRQAFAALIGAAAKARPGKWIEGGAWDEQLWGGELPTREWIDAVTPDTPVAVARLDLHMYLVNSVALKLAGITRDTPDPPGGVIVRDARGEPTGIIKDNAKVLVERVIPPPSDAETDAIMRGGIAHGLSHGVAQAHVPELDWKTHHSLRRLRAAGETDMRFYSFVPLGDWEKLAALVAAEGRGDDWVRWGGLKGLADGSLGSRTALFHKPYADAHENHGVRVTSLADLRAWVAAGDKHGLQVTMHAIGDEANDDALDIFADVAKANGPRDRRFRIEHAQHLSPSAIGRFGAQKVIASVQPYHAIDDGRWAIKPLGAERLAGTYAFASLLKAGATVTFGSDWPVAPLNPLEGLYAAATRRTIDEANPDGWLPDQKISVEQAMIAYTRSNAFAGFQEDRLGVIAPGFLADLAIWDTDLLAVDPVKIRQTRTLRTFVNGRQRYGPA
jgi:predicted amidohydrolase YtcJ